MWTGQLAGVGIGVPGFILMEKGIISGSNNLPEFENFPVRDEIERRLGTPIFLENDANAAALGEKWMGAGSDVNDLVLLTLGTGIGGGIIASGKVLHGLVGMAGEIGHMTVIPAAIRAAAATMVAWRSTRRLRRLSAMAQHDAASATNHHVGGRLQAGGRAAMRRRR